MNKEPKYLNLSEIPYSQRQLIVVLPDEIVAATREAEDKVENNATSPDWKDIVLRAGKTAWRFSIFGQIEDIVSGLSSLAKARENGVNILQVSRSEGSAVQFPPGHPRDQAIYAAHPAMPKVYYTLASFHRMAFEHKFSEAINLLMSLGATQITVEHVRGWSQEFSARLSAALSTVEGNFDASSTSKNASSLLFQAKLKSRNKKPTVPDNLVWYSHEPTWQAIANGRINFGLSQFSLAVNYDDDFGVNAGLKVRVQKSGLDVGGKFEDHVATAWKIYGNFGDDA